MDLPVRPAGTEWPGVVQVLAEGCLPHCTKTHQYDPLSEEQKNWPMDVQNAKQMASCFKFRKMAIKEATNKI